MARQPRFEYAGAVYHVMARGDGGKPIFVGIEDRESFLYGLERFCTSHGWRVHARVLMGNHFHLLLGTYSKAWNIRRQRQGHVFQRRYKAVPVAGDFAADAQYFNSVTDYMHLNPARAGLAGGTRGKLVDYPWSNLRHFSKGNPPPWQSKERVLEAFKVSKDRRGRTSHLAWLEAESAECGGAIHDPVSVGHPDVTPVGRVHSNWLRDGLAQQMIFKNEI